MFGGIYWFGVDDAGSNCFVPMFCGITEIPKEFAEGNGSMVEYSPTSAFWTFTKVSNFVYTRYNDMIKHVNEKQAKWEGRFVKDIDQMTTKMRELCTQNPDAARKQLNAYSARASHEVCQEWNHLFEYLLVKYHDGNIKKEENGKFQTNGAEKPQCVFPDQPRWPDNWYRMIVRDCGNNIQAK
jgi:dipeptidase